MLRIVCLAALTAGLAAAQAVPTYRIDFTMHDSADTAAKARHYSMVATPDRKVTLNLGSREPVESAGGQYTYIDTGVNIGATLREVSDQKVQLTADLDLSGIVQKEKGAAVNTPNPTIGQLKLSLNAALTPGKAAQLGSVDDPVTGRRFDVEAAVTRITP